MGRSGAGAGRWLGSDGRWHQGPPPPGYWQEHSGRWYPPDAARHPAARPTGPIVPDPESHSDCELGPGSSLDPVSDRDVDLDVDLDLDLDLELEPDLEQALDQFLAAYHYTPTASAIGARPTPEPPSDIRSLWANCRTWPCWLKLVALTTVMLLALGTLNLLTN
jgi:hypothetical protein